MGVLDPLRCRPGGWDGEWRSWHGQMTVLDDEEPYKFTEDEVEEVLYHGSTNQGDWDGKEAAVIRLRTGRLVAWETFWGPTGDGFSEDAYGGDAHVYFGRDLNDLILTALTDEGRRLCGIPEEGLK